MHMMNFDGLPTHTSRFFALITNGFSYHIREHFQNRFSVRPRFRIE